MPTWSFITIQDSVSPIMEQLSFFHDHTMLILIIITVLTLYTLITCVSNFIYNKFILEGQELETIWTILPAFILIFIALPSMKILYLIEENKIPSLTLKVTGHQWYWSYEYVDTQRAEFDVFIDNSDKLRLLKRRNNVCLPINQPVRVLATSGDVIHSWRMPSIGVKVDANPGRLNQTFILSKRLGIFIGQCSEICGANHSFIPISIEISFPRVVIKYLQSL